MQESRERGKIDDEPNPKPVTGIHYCNRVVDPGGVANL